jgi:Arc/MetJ-type ribon-helix-helix transcriptional regulator
MTYCHTKEDALPKAKIAVTLDDAALRRLDRLVEGGVFPNRSQAIEAAVLEKLERVEQFRLARECALLDHRAEQQLADEGLGGDADAWPAY